MVTFKILQSFRKEKMKYTKNMSSFFFRKEKMLLKYSHLTKSFFVSHVFMPCWWPLNVDHLFSWPLKWMKTQEEENKDCFEYYRYREKHSGFYTQEIVCLLCPIKFRQFLLSGMSLYCNWLCCHKWHNWSCVIFK